MGLLQAGAAGLEVGFKAISEFQQLMHAVRASVAPAA